jgi:hypothetical protein
MHSRLELNVFCPGTRRGAAANCCRGNAELFASRRHQNARRKRGVDFRNKAGYTGLPKFPPFCPVVVEAGIAAITADNVAGWYPAVGRPKRSGAVS